MPGIVFAAITPHGFPLIPELSPDAEGAMATRLAMQELGRRFAATRTDVVIVATPHGTRVDGAICLPAVSRAIGTLRWHDRQVEMNLPVDTRLTDGISEAATAHDLPIAWASFGSYRRDLSIIPLDWGAAIPLWFLGHGHSQVGHGDFFAPRPAHDFGPPVVLMSPSRRLARTALVTCGRAVAEAAVQDGRRVAFVASCDWSHTHSATGPYGYHPAAVEVDAIVLQAIRDGDPGRLIELPEEKADQAMIDGLWQALILAGAMEVVPMRAEVLSYEAPTYYGMLVAHFAPR